MGYLVRLIVTAGVALSASPALAVTFVPSTSVPAGRQFADPDAALDNMSGSLRDETLINNLQGSGGRMAVGSMGFDGGSGASADDRWSGSSSSFGSSRAWGVMPSLSAAELYDHEPPFMPIVVGDPRR